MSFLLLHLYPFIYLHVLVCLLLFYILATSKVISDGYALLHTQYYCILFLEVDYQRRERGECHDLVGIRGAEITVSTVDGATVFD